MLVCCVKNWVTKGMNSGRQKLGQKCICSELQVGYMSNAVVLSDLTSADVIPYSVVCLVH